MKTAMIRFSMAVATVALSEAHDLISSEELEHNCFNFPATNFNRLNSIESLHGESPFGPKAGTTATDFTLYDLDGVSHSLGESLDEKPVALLWGMWTCPAFQGLSSEEYPVEECSYKDEWELVEAYKESVTFIHLVGPEPHPVTPDTNFDKGVQRMNYWSTVRQSKTHDARVTMAKKVQEYMHPSAILLPDLIAGNPYDSEANQPVWCTMGLAARSAMLVGMDGKIAFQQDWFQKTDFAAAIDDLVQTS